MQKHLRQLLSLRSLWYLCFAATFCFIVPIIYETLNATDITEIGFILFGFDAIFAVVVGLVIGKLNHSIFFTLFFPLMFLLTYGLFFDSYVRYFGYIYLVLTILAFGVTKK